MMRNITDAILDVQNRSTYLDALKSKYMLIAQDLMITIFDSEDSMTSESEEEIKFYINELTILKEELLVGLNEFTDNVILLNHELEGDD
ncbi:MAG: hypothetical protein E7Z77_08990 [Methanobrevibacter sp.]|uniref:hypothetical protein n=1 Tax=Methanobrevibacter sp. TaxID=66852 RepID=UPI0025E5B9A3|nr:hypothetical protein [Methanobrevibacter sp.]MBE6509529.1 hypothetical protein [Methanobrevibacter sp.]